MFVVVARSIVSPQYTPNPAHGVHLLFRKFFRRLNSGIWDWTKYVVMASAAHRPRAHLTTIPVCLLPRTHTDTDSSGTLPVQKNIKRNNPSSVICIRDQMETTDRENKSYTANPCKQERKRKKTEYKIHAPQKPNPSIISFSPSPGKREETAKSGKRTRGKTKKQKKENFTKARSRKEKNPDRSSDQMPSVLHAMHSNRLFPNPFIVMYIPPHVES